MKAVTGLVAASILSLLLAACGLARFEQQSDPGNERSTGGPGTEQPKNPKPEPGGILLDTFRLNTGANQVDILVIIDDSFSMERDQRKLGMKFNRFIESLGDIDWHVGVTATDVTTSRGLKGTLADFDANGTHVLTRATPNAQQLFLQTIVRHCLAPEACGSSSEQPLAATILAIDKADTDNAGFFRPDVDFVTLVISDEDEMSTGQNAKATRPQTVIDRTKAEWGDSKNFAAFGIIIKPGDRGCLEQQQHEGGGGTTRAAYYGDFVTELAKLSNGLTTSICADDYGPALRELGNRVRKLVNSFVLSVTPVPGTVQVRMNPPAEIPWRVEGKLVIFDTPPAVGTVIEIRYTPSSTR